MNILPFPRVLFLFPLIKGGPGSGNHHYSGRPEHRGGSAPDPQYHLIQESLRAHVAPWRHVEFSPEAWDAEFPNGQAHTPIGPIKLGENQRDKLSSRDRARYFGLIKPTLEAPTYIVVDHEPQAKVQERLERNEPVERPSVIQFIRAFLQEDGRHQGFMCVTVSRDGLEILVSASPRKIARLARSVRDGAILTVGSTVAGETASPGREDGLNKAVSFEYLTAFDQESQQGIVICAWGLFKALISFVPEEEPLLKRMSSTPTGARWITVHPGGKGDGKGVPVMVQETHHGSGVYHVIGGAGGKLNYLKIRGLKSEAEYKEHAAEKRKTKMELDQQRRDREGGLDTSKAKEKDSVKQQHHESEKKFIAAVGKAAGLTEKDTAFPHQQYAHLSPRAFQAMRNQHHAALVEKAAEFIKQQKAQVIGDPERLKEALGELPLLTTDLHTITVNDLDPVRQRDTGLRFNPAYGQRAADNEAKTTENLLDDSTAPPLKLQATEATLRRKETTAKLKQELKDQRPPELPAADLTKALAIRDVLDLIKAEKELTQSKRASQKANQEIDEAKTLDEVKAYNLQAGRRPVEDSEIQQDLHDSLRTLATHAFLNAVGAAAEGQRPEEALGQHLGVGAQAAADTVALTVAGHGLIDRSVIDVLGMEGAARAMAQRLHQTLSADELTELLGALEDYHVDHYTKRGQDALKEAKVWQDIVFLINNRT